jgi:hypothetical protein
MVFGVDAEVFNGGKWHGRVFVRIVMQDSVATLSGRGTSLRAHKTQEKRRSQTESNEKTLANAYQPGSNSRSRS